MMVDLTEDPTTSTTIVEEENGERQPIIGTLSSSRGAPENTMTRTDSEADDENDTSSNDSMDDDDDDDESVSISSLLRKDEQNEDINAANEMKTTAAPSTPIDDSDLAKQQSFTIHDYEVALSDSQLLQIATALVHGVQVKNRRYHWKTYKTCFIGRDAVDLLVHLTRKPREEALRIGRLAAKKYQLIEHVCDPKAHPELEDGHFFFRFRYHPQVNPIITTNNSNDGDDNISDHSSSVTGSNNNYNTNTLSNNNSNGDSQNDNANSNSSLGASWFDFKRLRKTSTNSQTASDINVHSAQHQHLTDLDIMTLMEKGVTVQDRRYHLRTYPQCFVAQQAIDFLVQSKIVVTRPQAVELGRRLARDYNFMEHVLREHEFSDKYLFFRFIHRRNRFLSIFHAYSEHAMMEGLDDMGIGMDDESLQNHGREEKMNNTASRAFVHIDSMDDSLTTVDFTPAVLGGDDSRNGKSVDMQTLWEIASALEMHLTTTTRKWRLRKYTNCFVATEAVSLLVSMGYAESRKDAVRLGRQLERQLNLFHHVCNDHNFADCYYFFRFTPRDQRFRVPISASVSLSEIARRLEHGVKVCSHDYRLKTYKNTFVAKRAVDFLVQSRLATSREDAVRIGRTLVEQFDLFERVTGDLEFCDDQFLFRFKPESQRVANLQPLITETCVVKEEVVSRSVQSTDTIMTETSGEVEVPLFVDNALDELFSPQLLTREGLLRVALTFQSGVKVKSNKYRGRIYHNTFIGSEAVTYLVNSSLAKSRKDAVQLGRRLQDELKLFDHVAKAHSFKDDFLFFSFSQDKSNKYRGSLVSDITQTMALSMGMSEGGWSLETVAGMLQRGVKTMDRRYHLRVYKDCFIGSDAVDFLVGSNLADSRVDAVDLGRRLQKELNLFCHVTKDHLFKDSYLFYRFVSDGKRKKPTDILTNFAPSELIHVARGFEGGIKGKDHRATKESLIVYPNTFCGSDGVGFILKSFGAFVKNRQEAVELGRFIAKEFNLFEHVTNDHVFEDSKTLLYFVTPAAERFKGMFFERSQASKNLFATMSSRDFHDGSSTASSFWDAVKDVVSVVPPAVSEFEILADDQEWARKLKQFERSCTQRQIFDRRFSSSDDIRADPNFDGTASKARRWAAEFRKVDPRFQILTYFNDLAQEGALEASGIDPMFLRPLLRYLPNRASVFSVWRPTSLDSIRRMMLGEAVGKGLEIKGKSAKRGKLSAFVPFLQISNNQHKAMIRMLSREGTVRVFYNEFSRRARDVAVEKLELVALEMQETVKEAKTILGNDKASRGSQKQALEGMLLDMKDPEIRYIDDYAPVRYGIEIPERLFWEAYFVRQDCSREQGSQYDTGRPSLPGFQDMNFAALRHKPAKGSPRVVIYQNADPDSPMNPFELLMAYEEDKRVLPVVSDFDCFLVGTRRVNFTSPLPEDQLEIVHWMLSSIEKILNSRREDDSWTSRWLDVLKKSTKKGFQPVIPPLGFGDPKSYAIMKNAVKYLKSSGAVRHGSECFNFYFPQELDDTFLVISDDVEGELPWKYVDVEGLLDILSEKVDQGFTFPLNPKWLLIDGGRWKDIYDKMIASPNENIVRSMQVWFPIESGIREEIDRIHARYTEGFYG